MKNIQSPKDIEYTVGDPRDTAILAGLCWSVYVPLLLSHICVIRVRQLYTDDILSNHKRACDDALERRISLPPGTLHIVRCRECSFSYVHFLSRVMSLPYGNLIDMLSTDNGNTNLTTLLPPGGQVDLNAAVAALSTMRLPIFWRHAPEQWFVHAEAIFHNQRIKSDLSRVNHV
ncbi:Uncharacterized protein FWK35_00035763, partial [Aphis craccivora]